MTGNLYIFSFSANTLNAIFQERVLITNQSGVWRLIASLEFPRDASSIFSQNEDSSLLLYSEKMTPSQLLLLLSSSSVMSHSLQSQGLPHARLPSPSSSPRACSKLLSVQQKSLQPSEASLTSLWNPLCLKTGQQLALQSSPVLILRGIRRRWPSPTGETEIRGGWAAGWAAGVGPLWTDTPRWRQEQEGGEAEPCPDKRKRPRVSHSQGKRELSGYTWTESLLGGQKGGGHHPIVSDVNYL